MAVYMLPVNGTIDELKKVAMKMVLVRVCGYK